MNLSFLSTAERDRFQRLFALSGCSDLVEPKTAAKLLTSLSREEFFESCSSAGMSDVALAAKGRPLEDLSECLHRAARSSNHQAISHFLTAHPALFTLAKKETGDLPLHTYLR